MLTKQSLETPLCKLKPQSTSGCCNSDRVFSVISQCKTLYKALAIQITVASCSVTRGQ